MIDIAIMQLKESRLLKLHHGGCLDVWFDQQLQQTPNELSFGRDDNREMIIIFLIASSGMVWRDGLYYGVVRKSSGVVW